MPVDTSFLLIVCFTTKPAIAGDIGSSGVKTGDKRDVSRSGSRGEDSESSFIAAAIHDMLFDLR